MGCEGTNQKQPMGKEHRTRSKTSFLSKVARVVPSPRLSRKGSSTVGSYSRRNHAFVWLLFVRPAGFKMWCGGFSSKVGHQNLLVVGVSWMMMFLRCWAPIFRVGLLLLSMDLVNFDVFDSSSCWFMTRGKRAKTSLGDRNNFCHYWKSFEISMLIFQRYWRPMQW